MVATLLALSLALSSGADDPSASEGDTAAFAARGGAIGATVGLGAILGYLLVVPSRHPDVVRNLPLRGAEIFAAVPVGTTLGAIAGAAIAEATSSDDADWTKIAAAAGGGLLAGALGGVLAVGVGIGTMLSAGYVLAALQPDAPGMRLGAAVIAGSAVGSAAMIAIAAAAPYFMIAAVE